jgi:hypothetical protein
MMTSLADSQVGLANDSARFQVPRAIQKKFDDKVVNWSMSSIAQKKLSHSGFNFVITGASANLPSRAENMRFV